VRFFSFYFTFLFKYFKDLLLWYGFHYNWLCVPTESCEEKGVLWKEQRAQRTVARYHLSGKKMLQATVNRMIMQNTILTFVQWLNMIFFHFQHNIQYVTRY
jgi:hypothetical protein